MKLHCWYSTTFGSNLYHSEGSYVWFCSISRGFTRLWLPFYINSKAWGSSLMWVVQIRTPNWYEDKSVVIMSYGRMFFHKCPDKCETSPCASGWTIFFLSRPFYWVLVLKEFSFLWEFSLSDTTFVGPTALPLVPIGALIAKRLG